MEGSNLFFCSKLGVTSMAKANRIKLFLNLLQVVFANDMRGNDEFPVLVLVEKRNKYILVSAKPKPYLLV